MWGRGGTSRWGSSCMVRQSNKLRSSNTLGQSSREMKMLMWLSSTELGQAEQNGGRSKEFFVINGLPWNWRENVIRQLWGQHWSTDQSVMAINKRHELKDASRWKRQGKHQGSRYWGQNEGTSATVVLQYGDHEVRWPFIKLKLFLFPVIAINVHNMSWFITNHVSVFTGHSIHDTEISRTSVTQFLCGTTFWYVLR